MQADPFGLIGQVLDGQFRVDRLIGEGGFSAVYKGQHLGLEEPIAIKCLKLTATLGTSVVESFMRRFRDESRLLYRLSQGNLNIVRSIASGTTTSPTTNALVPYMVLEWLDGRSLEAELEVRRVEGKTGRPLSEVIKLLDHAADAVAFAHSQGVAHRDLNPGNVFLAVQRDGTIKTKVLDFGVAKVVSDHALELGPRARTHDAIRIFSPAYGAPEQFEPQLGAVALQTDVYCLALLAVEALCDRPVVEGEHLGDYFRKKLDPALKRTPRALGVDVGVAVEAVFAQALSLAPADRQKDVGAFWSDLKGAARIEESGLASTDPSRTVKDDGEKVIPVSPSLADLKRTKRLPQSETPPPQSLGELKSTVRMSNAPSNKPAADGKSTVRLPPQPSKPRTKEKTEKEKPPRERPSLLVYVAIGIAAVAFGVAVFFGVRTFRAPAPATTTTIVEIVSVSQPNTSPSPSIPVVPLSALPQTVTARPKPPSTLYGPFNAAAGRAALDQATQAIAECKKARAGQGVVHVKFAEDGTVQDATIDKPPFAGTEEAACIVSLVRKAAMPPFSGPPKSIDYPFKL